MWKCGESWVLNVGEYFENMHDTQYNMTYESCFIKK